jgi:hypothetical protein
VNIIHFVDLVDSRIGTPVFVGHIYAMVSPKGNEWGTNFSLACFLEGKKTLNVSLMDFEGNKFPIGSMVIKEEYLTRIK